MADRTQTARSVDDQQAVVRSLDQLSEDTGNIAERVDSIELMPPTTDNPQQAAIAPVGQVQTVVSPTYIQTEVDQLSIDIKALADKVDSILTTLKSANIIS